MAPCFHELGDWIKSAYTDVSLGPSDSLVWVHWEEDARVIVITAGYWVVNALAARSGHLPLI